MSAITVPSDWVESVSKQGLPRKSVRRLQKLMDLNNEGMLTPSEKGELESLVALSEQLSLSRARALQLLGKRPK